MLMNDMSAVQLNAAVVERSDSAYRLLGRDTNQRAGYQLLTDVSM